MRVKLWERILSGMPMTRRDRIALHRHPSGFEESQLQGVGQNAGQKFSGNKKAPDESGAFEISGGGTVRYFNLPQHLSKSMTINKIIRLNCHYVHQSLW